MSGKEQKLLVGSMIRDKEGFYASKNPKCNWKPNDANQNPWYWIKILADAQEKNLFTITDDIGCSEMQGCWSYSGNQIKCIDGNLAGACIWIAKANDSRCFNEVGCCYTKSYEEEEDNETLCNPLKN